MSSNTFLIDAATRHAVFIQRFAGGQSINAQRLIDDLYSDLQTIVLRNAGAPQQEALRLQRVLTETRSRIDVLTRELDSQLLEMAFEFAEDEAQFSLDMIQEVSEAPLQPPTTLVLQNAILTQPMDTPIGPGGVTVQEALDTFANNKATEVQRTLNDGVLRGQTLPQISAALQELVPRARRQVDTITRTIVNHTSNQARAMVMEENQGLLSGYEWVAKLDHRTTLICAGRDGKIYEIGNGPVPPAHFNCRSVIIPTMLDSVAIDTKTGDRDGEPGTTTYQAWLRRQPAKFQDEVLGPTRAALFRRGNLEIERFRDETGRVYTLEELRQINPLAFERAGLDAT